MTRSFVGSSTKKLSRASDVRPVLTLVAMGANRICGNVPTSARTAASFPRELG